MSRYNILLLLLVFMSLLLSGCGVVAKNKNVLALENYPIGTSEEVMKLQLTKPIEGGKCETVTIGVDEDDELEACTYTLTLSPSRLQENYIYFYKDKYVGYGNKITFINDFIKKLEQEKNPLLGATEKNNIDEMKILLAEGANPNVPSVHSDTPLIMAVEHQHEEIVELLLDNGANPNMANKLGYSPLLIAASKNSTNILNTLLNHGAEINQKATHDLVQGATPLMVAVINNKIDIVKSLVASGADLNIVETKYGNTPFLQAAIKKFYEIAEFFVRNGADIEIPDYQGITAQQLAINTNDNRLLEIIRFNPQLVTLENIESQYEEEFITYQKRNEEHLKDKEKYEEKELRFLNDLNNEQLKLYSTFVDNIKQSENRAKILLSFREFSGSLNNNKKDEFVQLYSMNQSLMSEADLLEKMDQNLIDRKKIIVDLKEEIAKVEKQRKDEEQQAKEVALRNQQQLIANQNAQAAQATLNTVGMFSLITTGLNTYNSIQAQKYNAQAEAYRQYSERYDSDRRNQSLVNSLYGIETAIRNSGR